MESSNFELVCATRSFSDIADDLSRLFLGGLDVGLIPIGPFRALLREHIVRALIVQHPESDPWTILSGLGVQAHRAVSDDQALTLVDFRFADELGARPETTAPATDTFAWHLNAVRIPDAWALVAGPGDIDWRDTVIGHIDTGYTKHPALGFGDAGGSWIRTADCRNFRDIPVTDAGPIGPAEPADGTDPLFGGPNDGHGTRIGATISGHSVDGDGGRPFFGAAPKVPHVVVRISDSVIIGNQQPALAQALDYLVDTVRVGVVNLSMGIFPRLLTRDVKRAINNAYDKGVILVCAAGNVINPVVSPAFDRRTLAVGGITVGDLVWHGGSFGPTVDWAAPADQIRRANVDRSGQFDYGDGGDGTSYATALTTGTAALWLTHRNNDIRSAYPEPWQRVAAFRELGRATTRRPDLWQDGVVGTGILDAGELLAAPLPTAASLAGKKEDPL